MIFNDHVLLYEFMRILVTNLTFYGGVNEIGAKTLFPIHAEHPDVYEKITKNLTLVKEGLSYNL